MFLFPANKMFLPTLPTALVIVISYVKSKMRFCENTWHVRAMQHLLRHIVPHICGAMV